MDMYKLLSKIDELQTINEAEKTKTHKGGEKVSDPEKGVTKHHGKYGNSYHSGKDDDSDKKKSKPKKGEDEEKEAFDDWKKGSDKSSGKDLQDVFSKSPKSPKKGKVHTFKEWVNTINSSLVMERKMKKDKMNEQGIQPVQPSATSKNVPPNPNKQGTGSVTVKPNTQAASTLEKDGQEVATGDRVAIQNLKKEIDTGKVKLDQNQQITEKWNKETKVAPSEKGKYEKKTIAQLEKMYDKLKASGPHKKGSEEYGKMRELSFAIRAKKKKDKWGKLKEGYDRHAAAYHEGKSHAMEGGRYSCRYDEGSDEHRRYHDGFKEGLDECYGGSMKESSHDMVPDIDRDIGKAMVSFDDKPMEMIDTVMDSACDPMDEMSMYEDDIDEMKKGDWMKHKAKSTPGDTFKAFGQTFKDKEVLEDDPMFESWEKQFNAYLTEGVTITTSTGQQGLPDNVSISASGEDASELLSILNNSGMLKTGAMPKQGHLSPMTTVKGDTECDGSTNMAAVSVRSMPDGMGMSVPGDYESEVDVNKPYGFDEVQSALDDGGYDTDTSSSSMLGSLSKKLMALEAKAPIMPSPKGFGMSQPATEKPRKTPEAVDNESVEKALSKDAKRANKTQTTASKDKSIYKESVEGEDTEKPVKDPHPDTPVMRMPAGKGFSQESTEKPDDIAEPTNQEEIVDALGKDAKKQGEVEFNALKALLDKQNMLDGDSKGKKTVKEAVDGGPDEGNLVMSMPYGKGMSTEPTEEEREAPEAFGVDQVIDAISKDAKKEVDKDDGFDALKKLIAAHIKLNDKEAKGDDKIVNPSEKGAKTSDFENSEENLETKKPSREFEKKVKEDETEDQRTAQVAESLKEWANTARSDDSETSYKDETFTTDTDFMVNNISGGINKIKKDQTTLPHTKVKVDERSNNLRDWLKLAGIK